MMIVLTSAERAYSADVRSRQESTLKYTSRLKAHDVAAIHDSYRERAGSVYTPMGVIGGRWNPMIFRRLEQLRQIEADGVIARRALNPTRMGVRVRLTPYGRTLHPVFEELWSWGTRHLKERGASQGTMVRPPQ